MEALPISIICVKTSKTALAIFEHKMSFSSLMIAPFVLLASLLLMAVLIQPACTFVIPSVRSFTHSSASASAQALPRRSFPASSQVARAGALDAKKRKRKDGGLPKGLTSDEEDIVASLPDYNPSFLEDDDEGADEAGARARAPPPPIPPVSPPSTGPLRVDRSLEATFEFDKVETPLPRPSLSKRKAKRAFAGQQASTEAADTRSFAERFEASSTPEPAPPLDPISKLRSMVAPKDNNKPKEPFNFVKLIENSTWIGIGALVLWEVYINSPLFERAAPMAPVVY